MLTYGLILACVLVATGVGLTTWSCLTVSKRVDRP
jgi:hypothetical protein